MRYGLRGAVWAAAALCLGSWPAAAQDRLTIGIHEVKSSPGVLGATVGPAGALAGELADGGRVGLLFDHLIETASGRRINYPAPSILTVVAADPARARGFFVRGGSGPGVIESVVAADLSSGATSVLVPINASGSDTLPSMRISCS